MSKTATKVGASRGRVGGGGGGAGGVDASGNLIKPQWSTVISDGVLALCTLYACGQLYQAADAQSYWLSSRGHVIRQWQLLAVFGLGVTGVAAAAGTLRFAAVAPARPLHDFLTQLAQFTSMPLLGMVSVLAYTGSSLTDSLPAALLALVASGWLLFTFVAPKGLARFKADYTLVTSLFGVMCLFFRAAFVLAGYSGPSDSSDARSAAGHGLVGALLIMLSGAVGATGTLQLGPVKLLRVDVFHYGMAIANICLVHFFLDMWQ